VKYNVTLPPVRELCVLRHATAFSKIKDLNIVTGCTLNSILLFPVGGVKSDGWGHSGLNWKGTVLIYTNASIFSMINDLSISLSSFNCAISLIASRVYKLYGNEIAL